jgi:hypothetical protein
MLLSKVLVNHAACILLIQNLVIKLLYLFFNKHYVKSVDLMMPRYILLYTDVTLPILLLF